MFTKKNSINKQTSDDRIKSAYIAGHDAIIKALGRNVSHEELFNVAVLLALAAVTANNNLTMAESTHNTHCFMNDLSELVMQKMPESAVKTTSRLM